MGEICAKMADFSILTEDNNRFEKVEDILADIRVGMNKGNPDAKFVEIPDRLDALHYAVDHAQEGDLIAVIGKGHETYRDREGVKTPFLSCWKSMHSRSGWNKNAKNNAVSNVQTRRYFYAMVQAFSCGALFSGRRFVMLFRLMPMVDRLCSMAEEAGCRMPRAPSAMRAELKVSTKR